jgi:hypothetical protein
VIGKVFYITIVVVFAVMWLQWHAIITHGISAMLAKVGISMPGNLSVFCSPVLIDGPFFDLFPRSTCRRSRASRREGFFGGTVL